MKIPSYCWWGTRGLTFSKKGVKKFEAAVNLDLKRASR
jgi:hypothetical protein